jgi:hypothetical protein
MQLLLERAMAGGTLPDEKEAIYVDELDRCWWSMTENEQNDVEAVLAQAIDAPTELNATDTTLTLGTREPPRQKAA